MLDEIFKTNPKLLEEPEVQALIKYAEDAHKKFYSIHTEYKNCHDEILELLMYSELILIKGRSSKETLELIHDSISKF
jgi:hypothetical protein